MTKKERVIHLIKLILELVVLILLILYIIYLVKSNNGVLAKIDEGNASEKLDTAIKIFASTDGMKLEDSIRSIEGLQNLEINEETGEYNVKIDGQEFLVISQEIIPEEEEDSLQAENTNDDEIENE
jgi:hypothetical protein